MAVEFYVEVEFCVEVKFYVKVEFCLQVEFNVKVYIYVLKSSLCGSGILCGSQETYHIYIPTEPIQHLRPRIPCHP